MFPVDYNISLKLNYCYNKRRGIKLTASLECKECLYVIRLNAESQVSSIINLDSRDMVSTKVKSVFRIYKAYIGDTEVKLKWEEAKIIKIRTRWKQGEPYTEWEFSIDSFVVETPIDEKIAHNKNEKYRWFLVKNNRIKENLKLKESGVYPNRNVYIPHFFKFGNSKFGLWQDLELDYPQLFTETKDENSRNKFLKCVSFYYSCEIEVWLLEELRDNKIIYSYQLKNFIDNYNSRSLIWSYYRNVCGQKITLEMFISSLDNVIGCMEEEKQNVLFKSFRSFTNSLTVNAQHKLTDYCAIILTIAQYMHETSFCQDIELAQAVNAKVGIDFNKVNGNLNDQGFIRSNDKKKIKNYVELRNEVIHGLPSDKIIAYLNSSFIVDRLEHATFITILYECGFKNMQFSWHFQEFNVLKNAYKYTYIYKCQTVDNNQRNHLLTSIEYPWMNMQVIEVPKEEYSQIMKAMEEKGYVVTVAPGRCDFICIQADGGEPKHPTNIITEEVMDKALTYCQQEAAFYWAEYGKILKNEDIRDYT